MKKSEWIAALVGASTLLLAATAYAADAPKADAPSELSQDPRHGPVSPSTSALRNPNDPDTKNAETRSKGKEAETGRGHATGEAGETDLSSGEKKSPEASAAEHEHSSHDHSLSGRQH